MNAISWVKSFTRRIWAGLLARKVRTWVRRKPGFRPVLERLEDIITPAPYYWNPAMDAPNLLSSTAANWARPTGENTYETAPGVEDTLIFNGDNQRPCTFNFAEGGESNANAWYAAIRVEAGYTGQLTLQRDVSFLGMNELGHSNQSSFLDGANIIGRMLGDAARVRMTFGGSPLTIDSIRALNNIYLVNAQGNSMTIAGGASNFASCWLVNRGNASWIGAGTLNLDRSSIFNSGQFEITVNANIAVVGEGVSTFHQDGTMSISGNGRTTTIAMGISNSGTLNIGTGATLALSESSYQTGVGSRTILNSGTLTAADTYFIEGGGLLGVGTIQGNVSMTRIAGLPDPGTPRYILPGTEGLPGLLTVQGDLTLTSPTRVIIGVDAASIGTVTVTGNIAFGFCTIRIDRNLAFTPEAGHRRAFMSSATSTENILAAEVNRAWGVDRAFEVILNAAPAAGGGNGRTIVSARVFRLLGAVAPNAGDPALLAVFEDDPDFVAALRVSAIDGNANDVGQVLTTPAVSSFKVLSGGSFDFVPPEYVTGDDSFEYDVTDEFTTKTAVAKVYFGDTNPFTLDAQYTVTHDTNLAPEPGYLNNGLLDYALNFDPENLGITEVNSQPTLLDIRHQITSGAWLTVHADGSFLYEPVAHSTYVDSFAVTVGDGTSTGTINVTINVVNSAPVLDDRTYSTLHGTELNITPLQFPCGLLDLASDDDGDTLTITHVNGDDQAVGVATDTEEGGSVLVDPNGGFDYTPPDANFTGQDSFTVTVWDGAAAGTITVIINVNATTPKKVPEKVSE